LLARMLAEEYTGDEQNFSIADLLKITFVGDSIYKHRTARFNHTTYNQRRASDTVNPHTHPDVMLRLQDKSSHPYRYVRVIGIYHAKVSYKGHQAKVMSFLHVRWLVGDPDYNCAKRLPHLGYLDCRTEEDFAFGFLDPEVVIRSVHLIPAFGYTSPNTEVLLKRQGPSLARCFNSRTDVPMDVGLDVVLREHVSSSNDLHRMLRSELSQLCGSRYVHAILSSGRCWARTRHGIQQ
jgi:hypothetical protein